MENTYTVKPGITQRKSSGTKAMFCVLMILLTFTLASFKNAVNNDSVTYKLTVERIFPESDEEKIVKVIRQDLPQLEDIKIDYTEKTITLKMNGKIDFDLVKQSFDKVGLKITKEEKSGGKTGSRD